MEDAGETRDQMDNGETCILQNWSCKGLGLANAQRGEVHFFGNGSLSTSRDPILHGATLEIDLAVMARLICLCPLGIFKT